MSVGEVTADGWAGDKCGCGAFRYAGHVCRVTVGDAAPEIDRVRDDRRRAQRVFDALRGITVVTPDERALLARLVDAERTRLDGRIAELEAVTDVPA